MELTELTDDLDKKKYWQEYVASWRVSNLNQAEYFRINGLRTYVFSYWKRKENKTVEDPSRFFPFGYRGPPVDSKICIRITVEYPGKTFQHRNWRGLFSYSAEQADSNSGATVMLPVAPEVKSVAARRGTFSARPFFRQSVRLLL